MPLAFHHVHPLVAHARQAADERVRGDTVAGGQAEHGGAELVRAAHALHQRVHGDAKKPRLAMDGAGERVKPPPGALVAGRAAGQVDFAAGQTRGLRAEQLLRVVGRVDGAKIVGGHQQHPAAGGGDQAASGVNGHAVRHAGQGGGDAAVQAGHQPRQGGGSGPLNSA